MNQIPQKVTELLNTYFVLLDSRLPGFLEGFYIFGSVSLGAFAYGLSDVDFIAVVQRKVTDTDITVLKQVHKQMKRQFPKTDLMGVYLTRSDLSSQNKNEKTCPCFIDGKFKGLERFKKNSIDAWQLKRYGITVRGPGIGTYDYTVDWDVLIHNMRDNLNTYWLRWKNSCEKFPSLRFAGLFFSLKMIEWGVLGVSRLYYTFREKDMTSKVGAGEYVLQTVPERWHKIIHESLRLRKGIKKTYYASVFERRRDALGYIDFIMQESNHHFQNS
jgi:hypothetical protein